MSIQSSPLLLSRIAERVSQYHRPVAETRGVVSDAYESLPSGFPP